MMVLTGSEHPKRFSGLLGSGMLLPPTLLTNADETIE